MLHELLGLATAGVIVAAVVVALLLRTGRTTFRLALAGVAVASLSTAWHLLRRAPRVRELEITTRPIEVAADGYVTSTKCRACHPHEYATWHDSYHRKMTSAPAPDAVLGDFNDVRLTIDGKTYHLQRSGDEFWVEMDNPIAEFASGQPRVRQRIGLVTGSHHMQAYWFESGFTRTLGLLPFTWLVSEGRWTSRRSVFVMPPSDPVDPSLGTWSMVCSKCHATHSRPRVDYEGNVQRGHDTHVGEFGIACEACHGPARDHVAANQVPTRRYAARFGDAADSTIVNPARLDPARSTQVCGQCHGQWDYGFTGNQRAMDDWFRQGFSYRPGDDLLRSRKAKFSGDEQFWSDGLIRVAGREYNALVGSACHDRGAMTCLSCHVMHQPADDPRPRPEWANDQLRQLSGDQTCLQCHAAYATDVPAHTHHAAGSEGSRCQNCHMPHTTYGLMKGVRTHRIASPTVQSTLATGRPNACNQCHLDQTLGWTAERLHEWYGTEIPSLSVDDRTVAAGARWTLKGDAAQRALMAWTFGWQPARQASGDDWFAPYLAELLDDPYEVVRNIADRSRRSLPGFETLDLRLDSAAERTEAKAALLTAWRQRAPRIDEGRAARVLVESGGSIRNDPFRRLLRERDQRLVKLFE